MSTLKVNKSTKVFLETGSVFDATEIAKIKVNIKNYKNTYIKFVGPKIVTLT